MIVVLAAAELFATMRTAGHQPATLLGLVASASVVCAAYWRGETALPLVLGPDRGVQVPLVPGRRHPAAARR